MKKGFVLLETIVVISVLCITLIMLYAGYMNVIELAKRENNYDNTEYINKTAIIRDVLNANMTSTQKSYVNAISSSNRIYKFCEANCTNTGVSKLNSIFSNMNVYGIYFTVWETLDSNDWRNVLPTTQRYMKYLDQLNDVKDSNRYRLIVMFQDTENTNNYYYASLMF